MMPRRVDILNAIEESEVDSELYETFLKVASTADIFILFIENYIHERQKLKTGDFYQQFVAVCVVASDVLQLHPHLNRDIIKYLYGLREWLEDIALGSIYTPERWIYEKNGSSEMGSRPEWLLG